MQDNLQFEVAPHAHKADAPADVSSPPTRERRPSICIVSVGSVSQNPRVTKEADALAGVGYDVVVLFLQHFQWARELDRQVLERARWRADIIDVSSSIGGRIRRMISATQLRLFGWLSRWTKHFPVAELAYSQFFLFLLWRAVRNRADVYIGHYPGSLPVVSLAAWWTGTKFGFDFEDFHRGEMALRGDVKTELLAALEDRYLPAAKFLTASSWGIADEVARTTGLPTPTTVLNVFSWSDRAGLPAPRHRVRPNLSLYWFSQIASLDRGLQDAIVAMTFMRERAELHIRGDDVGGSIESLRRLAQERGVSERVFFHPVVAPDELLASAACHDVGLCLEVPATPNRDACITNKIFLYMQAGLAIVASRTRGQSDVLNATPDVGVLYESGDIHALAAILDSFAWDAELLSRTKAAALKASRDRWNWEREAGIIIAAVDRLFSFDSELARTVVAK